MEETLRIEVGGKYRLLYTNWKGDTAIRNVLVREVVFGVTEHHKEPGLLLECLDLDKEVHRTFNSAGIHEMEALP